MKVWAIKDKRTGKFNGKALSLRQSPALWKRRSDLKQHINYACSLIACDVRMKQAQENNGQINETKVRKNARKRWARRFEVQSCEVVLG